MKFKNLNITRNFHAMKEISHSYNWVIYFISDNLGGKNVIVGLKKSFTLCLWSKQCWESKGVSEDNWSTCFLIHGFVWAVPGLGVVALVSLGVPAVCAGQTPSGRLSAVQKQERAFQCQSEWNWCVFQSVAGPELGWVVPEVVIFLENG